MKYLFILIVLIAVLAALGDEKKIRIACFDSKGFFVLDMPENEFHKMDSGSLPQDLTCEEYDGEFELLYE